MRRRYSHRPRRNPPRHNRAHPAPEAVRSDADIFDRIERLAALHAKGILTDQEFEATKSELLSRL
ncbi:SHOCT domain-containing protein [Ensifer sp. ENS10]|nr:SHOCT domain-containing protein [Ensifer sp. ENS10]